jgi:transposase-like protein
MSTKRRQFSPDFKFDAVMELLRGQKPVVQICRERQIKDTLLYKWRDAFLARAPDVFSDHRPKPNGADQTAKIAELERLVGRLTLENDILKKADSLLSQMRRNSGR